MPGDFQAWWSSIPSRLDPYIFEIGSFRVGYYGLMYIVGFLTLYGLLLWRLRTEEHPYDRDEIENYLVWAAIGLIVGARVGYVLIYNAGYYMSHPLEILFPFSLKGGFHYTGISGMSYHGGALGITVFSIIYCRARGLGFWRFGDFLAPAIPLGYTFGRIGNFINGELYGRATTVPWGMYFPQDYEGLLRHPSQLYEAFGEGIVLFAMLWALRRFRPFEGFHLGLYITGYGVVRFIVEFFREPDWQLGFVLGSLSMGQALSLLMISAGLAILYFRHRASQSARSG